MKTFHEIILDASNRKMAIGHFNISTIDALWGIFDAARAVDVPIIIGASEGERAFIGARQVVALVRSIREEYDYPIYINADHTYSFEGVKEAVDAGFDAVIFDGAKLPFDENVAITRRCVDYAKSVNPDIMVEGELGYIGTSSKVLDEIPEGVTSESMTTPEQAQEFVEKTDVDFFAPSVGNLHGMLRNAKNPNIDIERIRAIQEATKVPLVLHGGSGISDEDFIEAIQAGISTVHINTEIRIAYRDAVKKSLEENPDEVAPYRILKSSVQAVEDKVTERLKLFNDIK